MQSPELSAAGPAAYTTGRRKRTTRRASITCASNRLPWRIRKRWRSDALFCRMMMADAVKSRSLEEKLRIRDLSELIAESTMLE
jgi:hypothetical protein